MAVNFQMIELQFHAAVVLTRNSRNGNAKLKNMFLISTLIISLLLVLADGGRDLILVQAVFRNGFSAPDQLYSKDPNSPSDWEDGISFLTLMGRRQMYAVGKELRKRYSSILTSCPQEIYAVTSTLQKCMNSALSLLASLAAPTESWQFIKGLNWQPMPIFYWSPEDDMLLGQLHNCPAILKEIQKSVQDIGNKTILDMYEQQFKFWSLNSGNIVRHWNHASTLYRILYAEHIAGHKVPSWAWKYWKELRCLNDFAYKVNFNNPEIFKVFGGPMLRHMIEDIVEKIEGNLEPLKIVLYSGQSIHVAGLLGALGNFNDIEPPYASTVLMELYQTLPEAWNGTTKPDYSIRLLFINGTEPHMNVDLPRTLYFPGCGEFCPLQHMLDNTGQWSESRWEKDCKGSPDLKQALEQLLQVIDLGKQPMEGEIQW